MGSHEPHNGQVSISTLGWKDVVFGRIDGLGSTKVAFLAPSRISKARGTASLFGSLNRLLHFPGPWTKSGKSGAPLRGTRSRIVSSCAVLVFVRKMYS